MSTKHSCIFCSAPYTHILVSKQVLAHPDIMQQPRQYTPLDLMVIIYSRTMYTRSKSSRCNCKSVQRHIKSCIERKRSKHSSCAMFSFSLMLVEMTVWDDSRVELYSIHQRICVLPVLFTNAMFVSESLSSLCSIHQTSFSFLSADFFFHWLLLDDRVDTENQTGTWIGLWWSQNYNSNREMEVEVERGYITGGVMGRRPP